MELLNDIKKEIDVMLEDFKYVCNTVLDLEEDLEMLTPDHYNISNLDKINQCKEIYKKYFGRL